MNSGQHAAPLAEQRRVAIVDASTASVLRNRRTLISALRSRGSPVMVLAPCMLAGEIAALRELGAEHVNFDPNPPGVAPLSRWRLLGSLAEALKTWQAATALVSTNALSGIAALAARKAGVGHVVMLCNDLNTEPAGEQALRAKSYRKAARLAHQVIVHNQVDAAILEASGRLPGRKPCLISPAAGVDLSEFPTAPISPPDGPLTFLMIADPAERSAIATFAAAARNLAQRGAPQRFVLATDRESASDTSILTVAGVEFAGRAQDTRQLITEAHVVVHLSADDGCPVALMEALAVGRPVITLPEAACRMAVDERVNGCLVARDDAEALADACLSYVQHPELLASEGRASRAKAERTFDARARLPAYLAALEPVSKAPVTLTTAAAGAAA